MKSPLEQAVWKCKIYFNRYITDAKAGKLNSQELTLHYNEAMRLTLEKLTPLIPDTVAAKGCLSTMEEATKNFLDGLPFDGVEQVMVDYLIDNSVSMWLRALNWLLTDDAQSDIHRPQAIFATPYELFPTFEEACADVETILDQFSIYPREVEDWDKELSDVTHLIYDKLFPSLSTNVEIVSSLSLLLKASFTAVEDKLLSEAANEERRILITDIAQTWKNALEYFQSNPTEMLKI